MAVCDGACGIHPSATPMGLLFAGDSSGKLAVANRIDLVLSRFSVLVDGE
jgi:hypothetical protein